MKLEVQKLVVSRAEKVSDRLHLFLHSNTNNQSYYDVNFDNTVREYSLHGSRILTACLRIAHKRNIVLEVNHYYPYGMLNTSLSWHLTNNQLKYQDKEYLNTLNYNVLDFGARMYDPAIARFTTPDPIMQFNNGYFAMSGNPVSMIDPTGMKSTTGHYDDVQEHGLSETPERGGGGSPVTIDGMPVYGSSAMLNETANEIMQLGGSISSNSVSFNYWGAIHNGNLVAITPSKSKAETLANYGTVDPTLTAYNFNSTSTLLTSNTFSDARNDIPTVVVTGTRMHVLNPYSEADFIFGNVDWNFAENATSFADDYLVGFLSLAYKLEAKSPQILKYGKMINGVKISNEVLTRAGRMSSASMLNKMEFAGKTLGILGAGLTLMNGFSDGDLSTGDMAKVGIQLLTTFGGPIGWAYGLADLGFEVFSGSGLTDRIGNIIDKK